MFMISFFIIDDALKLSLSVSSGVSCSVSEEFYCDGQPTCCHRSIVAGTENSNVAQAEAGKACGGSIIR